jgi:hypothetical protein
VSFNGPELLRRCLESIAPQAAGVNAEILVAANWRNRGGAQASLGADFPDVKWIAVPDATTVPAMRQLGIAESRGEIVALIEDDCIADSGWCRAILAAHRTPDVAIGGAVEPGPYRRSLDWAVFFCEYGRFMPPLPERQTTDLAGNNLSYKREALASLPMSADGFVDFFVHRDWANAGRSTRADASIRIQQANSWGLRQVTSVPFHHGRGFAGNRFPAMSWPLRACFSGLALLLPMLAVVRLTRVVGSRRRFFGRLVQALPWIVVFASSWSVGEAVGYLSGPGDSLSRWR